MLQALADQSTKTTLNEDEIALISEVVQDNLILREELTFNVKRAPTPSLKDEDIIDPQLALNENGEFFTDL